MPGYDITTRPPEDQPQTFEWTDPADGTTHDRDTFRLTTLVASSEEVARMRVEAQELDIAIQEIAESGEFTDDPDGATDAALAKRWIVTDVVEIPEAAEK
jgi:hypothetical protein